ncbi:hypothetical protein FH972_026839 [Carpinus fangiana]|uniref:Zinc finger PHD-type domain-containing protein n=1 Tax=Carpinus fangiana TaxID=176857 RepID=A0A5N6L574_9ROSI|nr:hypothetical protein FH972_026839 [Carpinus fangiana]
MVVNDRPLKRMKRRVFADLHDFFDFPPLQEEAETGVGVHRKAFRDSVRVFLERHARFTPTPTPSVLPALLTWQLLFRVADGPDPVVVTLYVVEEDVTGSTRRSIYCDQCRVVGWSGHPVCRKRYHFIIRREESGVPMDDDDLDMEDWLHLQLEDHTHLLHAVVHSNGYAHLLTLNGREGGSTLLFGRQIMDFWDRLCASLAVRKVSVMDVSKKHGMEYRLLRAVTKGQSWYSEWGYLFGAGSYALTREAYQEAVDRLSAIPLSSFLFHGRGPRTHLQAVIAFYQSLSKTQLQTIRDLFSFLLRLMHRARNPLDKTPGCASMEVEFSTSKELCAWTRDDVECVQKAMMKVLLAAAAAAAGEPCWVTKRAIKGAMCKSASPELLDYCLEHLRGGLAADGMVVCSRYNPISSAVEFRIEPLSTVHSGFDLSSNHPSVEQIVCDLKFLYDSILHPETMVNFRPQAMRECLMDSATKLLDCKQFMKDYEPDRMTAKNPFAIHLWCYVELSDRPKDDLALPPELVVLPLNATVADLKCEVTKAFQEVYAMFKMFQAEELPEFGPVEDSITVKFLVGMGASIRVRGRCPAKHGLSRFRMERGMENWTVDCTCGAKDDDGERMLACDTCGVWQHTRCAGIDNSRAIPAKFVCMRCIKSYCKESRRIDVSISETNRGLSPSTFCRDEAVALATDGPGVNSNMALTYGVG